MNEPQQFDLLSRTPVSRSTDPETSAEAEQHINGSGQRATQQHRILSLVRRFPGMTSRELAARANMDRYIVGRRLSELAPKWIRRSEKRVCGVSRLRALTWRPVERNGTGTREGGGDDQ